MNSGITGGVLGAGAGVVLFILYLCALAFSPRHIPDAPSLMLGLQIATSFGAVAGGWIGVLIALLFPRNTIDRQSENPTS